MNSWFSGRAYLHVRRLLTPSWRADLRVRRLLTLPWRPHLRVRRASGLLLLLVHAQSLFGDVHVISTTPPAPRHEIILVVGAPGQESYTQAFATAAQAWMEAARPAGANLTLVGLDARMERSGPASDGESEGPTDRERLRSLLEKTDPMSATPLWVVYLGHGTFDRKQVWLNLRGPDVSGAELAEWLKPVTSRPLIIVHGGSASGPLIAQLSGKGRIVITATRSGDELNYARFGEHFAQAISGSDADIDQDGTTSILEAYLMASRRTQTFYTEANRMTTEHPLLDDNGDRLGTPPDWFQGVRVVKRPDNKDAAPDGFRARQLALIEPTDTPLLTPEQRIERDDLERQLEQLRMKRDQLPEREYLDQLEHLLLQLAPFYDS